MKRPRREPGSQLKNEGPEGGGRGLRAVEPIQPQLEHLSVFARAGQADQHQRKHEANGE